MFLIKGLFLALYLFAEPNVVLLQSYEATTSSKLTQEFEESFYTWPVNLIVHPTAANLHDLYHYLMDPNTHGLIWVSHGNQFGSFDFNTHDVSFVFQNLPSHVGSLAIVNCDSAQTAAQYGINGRIWSYSGKVNPFFGFRLATSHTKNLLFNSPAPQPLLETPKAQTETVSITRTTDSASLPAMAIRSDSQVLGTFPPLPAYGIQTLRVQASPEQNLIMDIGTTPNLGKVRFGDIQISSNNWKLESFNGKPIGITKRIFSPANPQ